MFVPCFLTVRIQKEPILLQVSWCASVDGPPNQLYSDSAECSFG